MKRFLRKRLTTLVLTGIAVPFLQKWGVPEDTIQWLIGAVGAWMISQGWSDGKAIENGNKKD